MSRSMHGLMRKGSLSLLKILVIHLTVVVIGLSTPKNVVQVWTACCKTSPILASMPFASRIAPRTTKAVKSPGLWLASSALKCVAADSSRAARASAFCLTSGAAAHVTCASRYPPFKVFRFTMARRWQSGMSQTCSRTIA
jgi:hypothetical protein